MQESHIGLSTASCLGEHEIESVNNVDVPGIISNIPQTMSESIAGRPVLQSLGSIPSYMLNAKHSVHPR